MKPTSVIFLIVAVLVACLGLLLCMSANNMAAAEGISLFSQTGDENNNYVTTRIVENYEDIKKIVVNVSDVNVHIYGNQSENKVELVNFTDGTYTYTQGKSSLQISDNSGLSTIVDLENFKINFNGFRDYLHYFKYKSKQRTINIYLTADSPLTKIDVTAKGNSDVFAVDLSGECDYKFKLTEGDLTVKNVTTDSSIIVESAADSTVSIENVEARGLEINAVVGYVSVGESSFSSYIFADIKSGEFDYDRIEDDFAGLDVTLSSEKGKILLWGSDVGRMYSFLDAAQKPSDGTGADDNATSAVKDRSIDVTVTEGKIKIH